MQDLPHYTVRVSSRAKRASLVLKDAHTLEVVVPLGYDRKRVAAFVAQNCDWIARAREKMRHAEKVRQVAKPAQLPRRLELNAIGEVWSVEYNFIEGTRKAHLFAEEGEIVLFGPSDRSEAFRKLLVEWLKDMGKVYLPGMFADVVDECGFSPDVCKRIQVRWQKSRWGSYSTKGTFSLNAKLLFFPPQIVRYLLVHELCHTVHPNHSRDFWDLVERYEPSAKSLRAQLNSLSHLPDWVTAARVKVPARR